MFNSTNYYEQSKSLPVQNSFQITLLKFADASTFIRETSKMATLVGLISTAASLVFDFNSTLPITTAVVSAVCWGLSSACANGLESQAQSMIKDFKELKNARVYNHIGNYLEK